LPARQMLGSQALEGESMSVLRLPRTVYNAIRNHGEETYPQECCGALLGHMAPGGWMVEAAIRASDGNGCSADSTTGIAPEEMLKIERLAGNLDFQIAGFYHSHSDHSAHRPDIKFADADRIGCSYVITEVGEGRAAETNSYLLEGTAAEDMRFDPQPIQIFDHSAGYSPY
jgi:proteasome lid subunit RPN8/RPN11